MKVFLKKFLVVSGMSSLMGFFIGLETTVASPLCYMVNESGQTIDLSHLCSQKVIKDNVGENRQQREENGGETGVLNRRIAIDEESPTRTLENSRSEGANIRVFPGATARDYYGTRRTVSLDGLANNFSRSTTNNVSGQYVLNNQGELQLRYDNSQ